MQPWQAVTDPPTLLGALSSVAPGTMVTADVSDVHESPGVSHLIIGVNVTVGSCVTTALDEMGKHPGTILRTDANAKFAGQSRLARVTPTR